MTAPDATAWLLQQLLLYLLLPLWLLAGFGDWLCHRVQRIERSSGLKESLLHLLMLVELGIGVCAALLLQVNAAVLALLLACCVAHELTTWWDLAYAASTRRIPIAEQWVHGLQQALPWVGFAMLVTVHRDQALAAIGLGAVNADWSFRYKNPPLATGQVAAALGAGLVLVVVPLLQEFLRCLRGTRATRS